MKRFLTPIALLCLLFAMALASSVQDGPPLKGEVLQATLLNPKTKDWKLRVKLLEEPHVVSSGFYKASNYKLGSTVETTTKRSKWAFKKGDKVTLQWQSYSGMGPNGPVGGLSWNLVSKP